MIRVYDATETDFNNNGIKVIQPLFAEITKADNSDYYIELEDTLDNIEYYQKGLIFRVPTPWGVNHYQLFRCDNPSIRNNRISCKAWHISYDAKNYLIRSAEATSDCNDAINLFNDSTDIPSPFAVDSDILTIPQPKDGETQFKLTSNKNSLFDMFELLVSADNYGGHWVRDNFDFSIKGNIGEDRGVTLAYSKNISNIEISENWDDVCTKILPYTVIRNVEYCLDGDPYVTLEENLYDIPYTKAIKFENDMYLGNYISEIEKVKIQEWLRSEAVKYLEDHKLPQVNYSLSANIDNVSDLGDTIHVKHPALKDGEYIVTTVLSIKYDAIRGKYKKIEFGNFKREVKNLRQEIVATVKKETNIKANETQTWLEQELREATANINSALGTSYVFYDRDQILITDNAEKDKAQNCMRINSAGIGFSKGGATFTSAWSIDGTLDMGAINVLNLTASLFKGKTLELGGLNNDNGTFKLYDNSNTLRALMDKDGITVYASNGDYVKLNAEVGFAGYNRSDEKIYWADGTVFHMENAQVENEIQIAGKIKIVPVSANGSVGVGFVALT